MFLTQYSGVLAGPIAKLFGYIISFIYNAFAAIGLENATVAIILFTIIVKCLMIPLNIKQQKASKLTSKMNPELQAIQNKYKGKKDQASQAKMAEETQAVYSKYGANPLSGCLPLLIQLPIMYALYYVIRNVPAYIPKVYDVYNTAAEAIASIAGFKDTLTTGLALDAMQVKSLTDTPTAQNVIDVLASLTPDKWDQLPALFPSIAETITAVGAKVHKINSVFGGLMTLNQKPNFKSITILVPILAAGFQWFQSWMLQKNQPPVDGNNQAASMTKTMGIMMPLMTGWFCYTFPIGIGLYWIIGSVFAIVQQYFTNLYLDKIDIDEMIKKNQMKALKKRAKRGEDISKAMKDIATTSTKNIETHEEELEKKIQEKKEYKPTDYKKSEGNYKASDISAIAHMLGNSNNSEEK